jgi:predicted nucleic acid-binding protein
VRTTFDIPDSVSKKTKLKAVEEGVSLKTVVLRALERETGAVASNPAARRKRASRLFTALDKAGNESQWAVSNARSFMTARCFADNNLFLYAGSKDPADAAKKKIARQLIATEDLEISAQVLQEFIAAASKGRLGIDDSEAKKVLAESLAFPVLPIIAELVMRAFDIKTRYQISYWDAAIVRAARQLGCQIIYLEDLNHGQNGGVIVQNPFASVAG